MLCGAAGGTSDVAPARGVAAALSAAGVSLHVLDRQSPTTAAASPIKTRDVGLGRRILISLPPSYDEQVSRRKTFNAVYVLDARLFSFVVDAARADHAAVVGLKDRQWHPELIVIGLGGQSHGVHPAFSTLFATRCCPWSTVSIRPIGTQAAAQSWRRETLTALPLCVI